MTEDQVLRLEALKIASTFGGPEFAMSIAPQIYEFLRGPVEQAHGSNYWVTNGLGERG